MKTTGIKKLPYQLFKNAIIVTQSDSHAVVERNALKNVGFRAIQIALSGIDLALEIADNAKKQLKRDEIIVCQVKLADISAIDFVKLIRLHPLLLHQPIIAIGGDKAESQSLLSQGFTAVLTRPLTSKAIDDALLLCSQYEMKGRANLEEIIRTKSQKFTTQHFLKRVKELQLSSATTPDESLIEELTVDTALSEGLNFLRLGQVDKAIPFLIKATIEEHTAGQAFAALATAYSKKGSNEHVEKYLYEAIKAYAYTDTNDKMLTLVQKYKERYPGKPLPIADDLPRYVKANKLSQFAEKIKIAENYYPAEDMKYSYLEACLNDTAPLELAYEVKKSLQKDFSWLGRDIVELVEDSLKVGRQADNADKVDSKEKKSFFKKKKKDIDKDINLDEEGAYVLGDNELDMSQYSSDLAEKLKDIDNAWDDQRQIEMFDDDDEMTYNENEGGSLTWNIMKATARAYKNMKKRK